MLYIFVAGSLKEGLSLWAGVTNQIRCHLIDMFMLSNF